MSKELEDRLNLEIDTWDDTRKDLLLRYLIAALPHKIEIAMHVIDTIVRGEFLTNDRS